MTGSLSTVAADSPRAGSARQTTRASNASFLLRLADRDHGSRHLDDVTGQHRRPELHV